MVWGFWFASFHDWILLRNIHQSGALIIVQKKKYAQVKLVKHISRLDFAAQHPSKLRFENTKKKKKHSSELGVFSFL
jgi:hypothetical protein